MHEAFHNDREFTTADLLNATEQITPLAVTMKSKIDELRKWKDGRARNASIRQKKEIVAKC